MCFLGILSPALPAEAKSAVGLGLGINNHKKAEYDETVKTAQALERTGSEAALARAVAMLQSLFNKGKGDYQAHLLLGRLYARQGKDDQALYALTEALMMTVDDPAQGASAREEIASIYMKRGDYDEAGGEFKRVVEFQPENLLARGNLGICYEQIGAYDKAIDEFNRVLKANPRDFTALYNLGLAYFVKEEPEKAFDYFGRAIQANPSHPQVSLAMLGAARCYEARGEVAKAADLLDKVIKRDPNNQYAYLAMAKIHKSNKEPGKALQCLRKAVSIAPRDTTCRAALADFLGEALNSRTASLDNTPNR